MRMVQRRGWRLDPLIGLVLVVGLGVVLTTTARAEEGPATVHSALVVSYAGALPALRERLREQTDGLLRSAHGMSPVQGRGTSLAWSLAAPDIEPALNRLHDPDGFVVEERATMTLVYKHRW